MPETHPLQPTDPRTLGEYRLIGRLGKGAQGTVFEAESADGRRVAIKLLHTRLDKPGLDSERFMREVAAARRVAQFCTAQVLGAHMDGEHPYIVSELVDGISLQAVVQRTGPRTGGALYRLAVGTVTALAAIHRAGVVHRDFKPSNVLLGTDGPRVIDFGIARAPDSAMTFSSGIVGTPAYMSPEQISGERVGPAADMFGWALTMVFAATGRPAFGEDSLPAVAYRVMHDDPDLSMLPDDLRPIVQACLRKRADERPTAADALFALLANRGESPGADDEIALNTGSQLAAERTPPAHVPAPAGPPAGNGWASPDGRTPAVGAGGWGDPSGRGYAPPRPGRWQTPPPYPMNAAPAAAAPQVDNDAFFKHAPVQERPDEARARRRRAAMVSGSLVVALALAGGVLYFGPKMFGPGRQSGGTGAQATTSVSTSPVPAQTHTQSATPTPTPTVAPTQAVVPVLGKQDGKAFKGHTKGVQTLSALSAGGKTWLVTGGQDGRVRLWDLARHRSLATMRGHSEEVYAVACVMVGSTPMAVSGGYDGSVRLWNLKTHKGKVLGRHGEAVYAVAVTKVKGKYVAVTGDADGYLRFWDLKKRKATGKIIRAHRKPVNWLSATHLGGRAIAVSASEDETVRMWDMARRKAYGKAYKGHSKGVYSVAVGNVDGKTVIASGGKDGKIRIWDPGSRKTIATLSGHKKIVYSLSFGTLDGRTVLLSGGTDGTIRLWDPETRKTLGKPVKAHKKGVYAVGIVPLDEGAAIVSAGKDKVVRLWKLSS